MKTAFRKWILKNYDRQELKDIANNGCEGGVTGLTYYSETASLYEEHEEEIWESLWSDADAEGLTILEMLAQFNGQKNVQEPHHLKNMLVWYYVEKTAIEWCKE